MSVNTIAAAPAAVRSRRRARLESTLKRSGAIAGLVLFALVFSLPTLWLLSTSLKGQGEYASFPVRALPATLTDLNYELAVTMFSFVRYLMNSTVLAAIFTGLTVFSSAAAGFAFSRHRGVPGRDLLFSIVMATMMVPMLVTLVPQFVLFSELGLTNSYWPWILWGIAGSPFHIFLFRQFFYSIPRDLEDAAEVDGAGRFRIFWQIFLPNSLPAVAAASIFAFTNVWGDWLYPSLLLSHNITPLAVKLATAYIDPQGYTLVTVTMAGVVIYVLPVVVVFFLAQRSIIQGVVTTGLKG